MRIMSFPAYEDYLILFDVNDDIPICYLKHYFCMNGMNEKGFRTFVIIYILTCDGGCVSRKMGRNLIDKAIICIQTKIDASRRR